MPKILKKILIFIIIIYSLSNNIFCQNLTEIVWTELGPFNIWAKQGRINCIAVDYNDENIIYSGAPTGGIWKSTTGGKNWFPISDFDISNGVSAIAISPDNSNVIYIGTGDKSGQTFGKDGSGIYKSTDGGLTWTNINNKTGFTNIYEILINPDNSNIMFVNSSLGFYKSTNAGKTWSKVHKNSFEDITFKPENPDILYAVSENELIKFYSNADKFEIVKLEAVSGGERRLTTSASNPDILYLMVQNQGFFKSETENISFKKISDCSYNDFFTLSSYCFSLAADNNNSEIIYFGSRTLWRSLDGGLTWETKKSLHPDNHFLSFSNSGILYCGNDGGICYTTDSANVWHDISKTLAISQVYDIGQSAEGDVIIAGTQDNGASICKIDFTKDTTIWKNIIMADVMRCYIDYSDKNYIYFTNYSIGGASKLRRTIDGVNNEIIANKGEKGIAKDEYFTSRLSFAVDKQEPEIMYLGVKDLYKCDNIKAELKDILWNKVSDFEGTYTISNIEQSLNNQDFAFLTRGLSFLYFTENLTDKEVKWTEIDSPVDDINSQILALKIHPANDEIIYLIQNNILWKSTDKGKNWVNYSKDLPGKILTSLEIDNQQEEDLYLGTSEGVYYKNIKFTKWQKINNNLPPQWITDIEIFYPYVLEQKKIDNLIFGKIRVATYGRGVWETNLLKQTNNQIITSEYNSENSDTFEIKKSVEKENEIDFIQNEKKIDKSVSENNLFNYIYKKSYSIQNSENKIVISFNFLNKKVISIFDNNGLMVYYLTTENQEIEINTEKFDKGIYFLHIANDDNFNLHEIEIK